MARIRTIKPEFWCDEKLSVLSAVDRLTFLGLISMADDYGRVHDNVKIIDAFVFPNTDDSVRESLANLSRMVRIKRGKSSQGMPIIEIVNWDKHQKVDKPQPKLALPPIQEKTPENIEKNDIRESFANHSRTARELVAPHTPTYDPDLRPTTSDRGSVIEDQVADATTRSKSKFVAPTLEEVSSYCSENAIAVNAEHFHDHYEAQGWKLSNGRAMADWKAAVRKWARNNVSFDAKRAPPKGKAKMGILGEELLS